MQPLVARETITTVPALLAAQRRRDTLLFIVIFITIFSLTPLVVLSGAIVGFEYILSGLVALIFALLVIRWPIVGFYVVAGSALLVEQGPLVVNGVPVNLYVFYWPPSLEGLIERPIGFLLILIFLVYICHRLSKREIPLRGGKLLLPFLFFLLCVAAGVLHGLATGGNLKITVLEVRPFWYLFVSYLLAYNLISQKTHIRTFLWFAIVAAGLKALQGVFIFLVVLHGQLAGHREILAHEESFFFVALLLVVILFCLHHRYRPQLYAALFVLPFVLVALVANQRRADYIAFLIGLAVAWTLIFWVKPQARKRLTILMLTCVALGAGYIAAFSHSTGGFSEPARAIVSIFQPDPTDASSNAYRVIENYDLKYTVRQNPVLGLGFGKPFLQPVLLPNILIEDPYYLYVPHNTIYWVWMRLGPIGFFALLYLFGATIVRGCQTAYRLQDRYLQLIAIYIIAVTIMEVIVAYADYQLFFYRNVIYLGLLIGILMKLPALDEHEKGKLPTYEATHRLTQPTISLVGRQHS